MTDERVILVSCGWCGTPLGRVPDVGLPQMDAHYQECCEWLTGEGLLKERPLAYAYEDDDD